MVDICDRLLSYHTFSGGQLSHWMSHSINRCVRVGPDFGPSAGYVVTSALLKEKHKPVESPVVPKLLSTDLDD